MYLEESVKCSGLKDRLALLTLLLEELMEALPFSTGVEKSFRVKLLSEFSTEDAASWYPRKRIPIVFRG